MFFYLPDLFGLHPADKVLRITAISLVNKRFFKIIACKVYLGSGFHLSQDILAN